MQVFKILSLCNIISKCHLKVNGSLTAYEDRRRGKTQIVNSISENLIMYIEDKKISGFERYTHKTSGFKMSGFKTSSFKTSSFKTSETSSLQNVRFAKRQVYKTSGLQNERSSKRPVAKKHPYIFCSCGWWKSAGSVAAMFAGKVMAVFYSLFQRFSLPYITIISKNDTLFTLNRNAKLAIPILFV